MPYQAEPSIDPVWRRNTLRQAELWIRKCLKHHKECRDHGHGIGLPTRVIDVGPSDGSKDPRLYIPAKSTAVEDDQELKVDPSYGQMSWEQLVRNEGPSAEFRYVSLSYCWGEKQNFVTTLENLESLKAGIPWDSLPQTMKGAISITRGLGIRYLWIDALCIVQDSPEDWTNESVKMADVYGGAFLTLSAAHGASVHDGLPRLPGTEKHRFPLQKDPLYSRAWALQERILSTRILIFGSDQMYWECHCSREGEDGKTLPKTISYRLPLKPTLQDWNFVVMDYSSRCLTNETDKLPALSGLADVFHRATNYTYIAGLWRETLLKDLLWKQQWMLYGNQVEPGLPSQYRAPSWSWASIDGNVRWGSSSGELLTVTTVVGTCVDPCHGISGAPIGDWICLRGPLLEGKIKGDKISFKGGGNSAHFLDPDTSSDIPINREDEALRDMQDNSKRKNVWSLLIGTRYRKDYLEGYGLILVPSGNPTDQVFRRIGYFITLGPKGEKPIWKSVFDECDDLTIFII